MNTFYTSDIKKEQAPKLAKELRSYGFMVKVLPTGNKGLYQPNFRKIQLTNTGNLGERAIRSRKYAELKKSTRDFLDF